MCSQKSVWPAPPSPLEMESCSNSRNSFLFYKKNTRHSVHKISTCCISGVNKDHTLVPRPNHLQHLLVAHLVHVLTLSHRVHLLYTDKGGSQRHGPKPTVKEEQTNVWVDSQELCHVKVVW